MAERKTPLKIKPVPFTEAIEDAKKRDVVLPDVYFGKLQGIEQAEAFSVSGMASLDQLQQTLDSLTGTLATGGTFEDWKKEALKTPELAELPRHRLDNIFRTNIQGAYARGRCTHIKRNKARRPYLMYSAINDRRTRPSHDAMDGHIAPVDDPIWQRWTAPNGYRCRCSNISLSEDQAKGRQQQDQQRIDNDPEAARARAAAKVGGPDQGWDYSPCGDNGEGTERAADERGSKYAPILRARLVESERQAQEIRDAARQQENPDDL